MLLTLTNGTSLSGANFNITIDLTDAFLVIFITGERVDTLKVSANINGVTTGTGGANLLIHSE